MGLGIRVSGLGLRAQGLGFRAYGLESCGLGFTCIRGLELPAPDAEAPHELALTPHCLNSLPPNPQNLKPTVLHMD